jgi:chaperonin GroES
MKIRPLHDRVLVKKRQAEETKSKGGIILVNNTADKSVIHADVLAVGKGKVLNNGSIHALEVKVGDHVIFKEHEKSVSKIEIDGEQHFMVREEDILGIAG